LRAHGSVIAAALPDTGGDIAAHIVVHQRRIGQRFFQIDNGRQPIELDGDVGKRVLGEIAAVREHDRQRLADVPYFALGERHLGALIENGVGNGRRRDKQRTRRPVIAGSAAV
jgi:hypothetical protein